MRFKIVDVMDNDVKASAQFEYRGYTVSMSTIFKLADPVAIF